MTTPGHPPAIAEARRLVEQAVEALRQADHSPVADHVGVLDGVHRSLQDALAALDEV